MKGIVLAGGRGSRLWPLTRGVSKQLLPVYNKPLIHYPVSTLMLAGIREIMVITTPQDSDQFRRTLGDGSDLGVSITYAVQEHPNGLAESFIIGEKFLGSNSVCLILGDNIFYGQGLGNQLRTLTKPSGAHVLAYKVSNPQDYGVIEFDEWRRVVSLEEKPSNPKSDFAITGLYFYENSVVEIAKQVKPSARGELEITSVNNLYLEAGKLSVTLLERGTAWLDTGTFDSLHSAGSFIKALEDRQGFKVGCLEEIAWRNGWIDDKQLAQRAEEYESAPYGEYLRELLD